MDGTGFVPVAELSREITEAEYSDILARIHEYGYENDVERDENGDPIDGDEYVLRGMRAINDAMLGL